MHQEKIPSPLPYLLKVLDKRQEERCRYSFKMLITLVLMAIGAKAENILAMSHWAQDNQEMLFKLGFRDKRGQKQLPSQATLYRFFWAPEEVSLQLEDALHHWAAEVLKAVYRPGELLCISVDGKHVKGSKRTRRGEKARHLLSCFVQRLGLTLLQGRVKGDEAKAADALLGKLEELEGITWLLTGDAAFAEGVLAETISNKQGTYLFDLKDNLAEVKANGPSHCLAANRILPLKIARCGVESFGSGR